MQTLDSAFPELFFFFFGSDLLVAPGPAAAAAAETPGPPKPTLSSGAPKVQMRTKSTLRGVQSLRWSSALPTLISHPVTDTKPCLLSWGEPVTGGNLLPGAGQDLMSSSAVGTACWLCPQLQQRCVPETLPAIAGGVLCALSPARVGLDRSCHAGKVPKALPLRRSSPLLCKLRVRSSVSRSAWGRSRPSATPPCPPRPGHSPQGGCCHRCGVAFTCKGHSPLPCAGCSRHRPASPGRARGQWGPAGGGERSPRAVLAEEARGSVQDAQSPPGPRLREQMVLAAQPPSLLGPERGSAVRMRLSLPHGLKRWHRGGHAHTLHHAECPARRVLPREGFAAMLGEGGT